MSILKTGFFPIFGGEREGGGIWFGGIQLRNIFSPIAYLGYYIGFECFHLSTTELELVQAMLPPSDPSPMQCKSQVTNKLYFEKHPSIQIITITILQTQDLVQQSFKGTL